MQLEEEKFGSAPSEAGGYEDPEAAFGSLLVDLFETLLVVLEASQLPEARSRLLGQAPEWNKGNGIGHVEYDSRFEYASSKPYEYMERLVDSIRMCVGEERSSMEAYGLVQLEAILRRTPVILRRRGCVPTREHDIQEIMQDYLEAFFLEYRPRPRIHGIVKDFEADCGVRDLKAAVEFKFAATAPEVARALSGVFEDIAGYSGSRDWTTFFSVIYQTEAFQSEDRVRTELTRAGALTWKGLLVTGAGQRSRAPAATPQRATAPDSPTPPDDRRSLDPQ